MIQALLVIASFCSSGSQIHNSRECQQSLITCMQKGVGLPTTGRPSLEPTEADYGYALAGCVLAKEPKKK